MAPFRTETTVSHRDLFCTETLPEVYGWNPRCPLPANERTFILYLSHVIIEGLVKERSLNSYLSAINQAHEDIRLPRPALGQGLRLTRSGLRNVEGEEFDEVDDLSARSGSCSHHGDLGPWARDAAP